MMTPLNIQKLYDRNLMDFRFDHLDTLLNQVKRKLPSRHFLSHLLPQMLAVEETVRPFPVELVESLPDYSDIHDYYMKKEIKNTQVFTSVKPGQGIDPRDSKKVMLGSMLLAATYQKKIEYDDDVPEPETVSRSQSKHTNANDAMSRRTGDTALVQSFHAFIEGNKSVNPLPLMETIRRPVREVHGKKHDWFQRESGNLVYKDYLPPVYSVNRIIAGQQHVEQVDVDDGIVMPPGLNEAEKAQYRQKALKDILKDFNQNEIKQDMNDRLETYIMAGKDDNDMSFTRNPGGAYLGDLYEHERPISKYVQDYFTYNAPNKPRFKQVQPGQGELGRQRLLDPRAMATMDYQSDISAVYNVGAGDDSIDLTDLRNQIR